MMRKTALLLLGVMVLAAVGCTCAGRPSRTHSQQQESSKEAHKELGAQ